MVNIRELRIGNWVYNKYHGQNIKITPFDFFTHGHDPDGHQYIVQSYSITTGRDLEPIPLTAEILEKNFEVTYNGSRIYEESDCRFYLIPLPNGKVVPALLSPGDGTPFLKIADIHYVRCYYVHQLQNILIDMGIDKEIIL